jgi:hypothetical protein
MAARSSRWSKNWKPAPPATETDGLAVHGPLIGLTVKFRKLSGLALRLRFPRLRSGLTPLQPSKHRPYAWGGSAGEPERVSQETGFAGRSATAAYVSGFKQPTT